MAEKVTWIELRRAIAARVGGNQKEVGAFLDEMVKQIVLALKTDGTVRIAGLGTFKRQAVAARKSVNVVTGEDIIIEGYDKVTFTPEVGIKELLANLKPAHDESNDTAVEAETPAASTPLQKLGEQATEIVGILADLGQGPAAKNENENVDPAPEPEPVKAEPKPEPVKEPEPEPVKEPEPEPEPEPVKEPEPEPEPEQEPEQEEEKKHHFLRDTLITLVCLMVIMFVGGYFLHDQMLVYLDQMRIRVNSEVIVQPDTTEAVTPAIVEHDTEVSPVTDTVMAVAEEPAPVVEEEPAQVVEEPQEEPQEPRVEIDPNNPNRRIYKDWMGYATMRPSGSLIKMAKLYYGSGELWVYIYEANLDRLHDPDHVEVGTKVHIPLLPKKMMNIYDRENMKVVRQLQHEFIGQKQ